MKTLKIVSYNIHKGKTASGAKPSLELLKSSLQPLQADLIFLQEVQGVNNRVQSLHNQPVMISDYLSLHVAYGCNAVRKHSNHGNALLSRFEILNQDNQDISDHRLEQRGLLHVMVDCYGVNLHCFVVHLGLFKRSRERQVDALAERIRRLVPEHEPIVIAGDFNDWNNKLEPRFVQALNLHEVFTQQPRTFPVLLPWLRLDRMYQRGFNVVSAQVLTGRPWSKISDHAPLWVELKFDPLG
ncbi:endonuclease/exonuclease/phosphatase family protein [Brackiella oedipodis]|uniref:endonuclease/exonuclease/phosphatase family protein n=1 Tax=Brackiella oedipodis TaxID=124225 RepID=UPI00048E07E2|nr:endonuclease/exonuclease/phosphatase family protein [Brackiella oedipodis]